MTRKIKIVRTLLFKFKVTLAFYNYHFPRAYKFFSLYLKCMKHTHASIHDLLHLYTFVETIHRENIKGDIVECGCWRGGSSAIMLKRARELNMDCHIYIYDSFEGLPPAREVAIDGLKAQKAREKELAWLKADYEDVVEIMEKLNIYDDRVHIVKGWFDQTTPHSPARQVALLHSDGDLYESTRTVLESFYHKVNKGGFVVNNDYGEVWIGAKKAMDEFVAQHCPGTPIRLIAGGGAYLRKP